MKRVLFSLFLAAVAIPSAPAAIQYAGGTNVNATCVALATKALLITCIETNLNAAGWTTISGTGTTDVLLESAATPTAGLQMRLRVFDNAGNCVVLRGRNVANSRSATIGQFLLPSALRTYRIIANKYQYFIQTDGASLARGAVAGGVPYVPTFVGITEGIWTIGNSNSDTDTLAGPSFKDCLGLIQACGTSGGSSITYWVTVNTNQIEINGNTNSNPAGYPRLVVPREAGATQGSTPIYRWHDNSALITEPLLAFSVVGNTSEAKIVGEIWDAVVITDSITSETTFTIDSHSWWSITNGNTGSGTSWARGTFLHVIP